jgi:hypothetical protein
MKLLKVIFLFLSAFLLLDVVFQFLINTKYSFPEPGVFHGEKLYNPYQGIDSTKWKKANFHLHTRRLFGLTAGATNTVQAADTFYKYFDYDITGISDYMRINSSNSFDKSYIPVYEHGYMFNKTHQIVINAKKTCWKDFFFRESLNDKQYIINCLKSDTSTLVTIVHPKLRNAYLKSDFRYLGNYDCIEIANSRSSFIKYYDQALSSGHKVFIMADDDAHNLSDISQGAHSFNVINGDSDNNSVVRALKTGKSYGVRFNVNPYRTNYQKKEALRKLPVIKEVNLRKDTLFVRTDLKIDTIRYIGQNGALKKMSANCNRSSYKFSKDDTYIRVEMVCTDGTIYYLNPVFRYSGSGIPVNIPEVNTLETSASRISFVFILFLAIFISRRSPFRLPDAARI